jgi:hypothetical protein
VSAGWTTGIGLTFWIAVIVIAIGCAVIQGA